MEPIKRFILIICCIFFTNNLLVQAQESLPWSLQKCINFAKQNNIQLKQLALQKESSAVNLDQSKANMLPNVNGNANYGLNYGRSIDPTTNAFATQASQAAQLSLNSSIILFNGFQRKNTIEQRNMEYTLAQLDIDAANNNVELSVLQAYTQILLSEEQLLVLQEQAALTRSQYDQMQKMINAGVVAAGDILDIEAQIANDEFNIVNAENAVAAAYLALAQTLNYYENIRVLKPMVELPSVAEFNLRPVDMVYENALIAMPQIKSAEMRQQVAEQRLKVARGAKYPVVSLAANLNSRYSSLSRDFIVRTDTVGFEQAPLITGNGDSVFSLTPIFDTPNVPLLEQLNENFGGFLGVNINIPIFNNFQVKNAIQLSEIDIRNNRLMYEMEQNNLRQAVEQAWLETKAAAKRYEASQTSVSTSQELLSQMERRLQLGAVSAFDYLITQNRLTTAELNLQSAKYEYFMRLKILDFYEGKPIEME